MDKKNNRVLWLINHKTLMEFEPALLEELGYEVYIPKLFPQTIENRSAGVSYEFDSNLTLQKEDLECLNNFNFYTTKITPKIRAIINKNFAIIIIPAYHSIFQQAAENFEGIIILRVFGLMGEGSYAKNFESLLGERFRESIERLGSRFYFGMAYEGLETTEPAYIKKRALYLPLGLPKKFFDREDSWQGGRAQLLFICPVIGESPYYTNVYREFKKDFANIPHVIAGWQSKIIDDPAVLRNVERQDFDLLLSDMKVMYYHSREPHHLFYHPLEAMATGMPVIFMQQGMLGQMDKKNAQPGSCQSIREARKKVGRILAGDKKLIEDIRVSQKRLLIPFTHDFCFERWQKNFPQGIKENRIAAVSRPFRIVIISPFSHKDRNFYSSKTIAKMIHKGSRLAGTPVDVIFSYVPGQYDKKNDFGDLIEQGIILRETEWVGVNRDAVERIMQLEGRLTPLDSANYIIPKDNMRDFLDTDLWIFVADSLSSPPAPLRRYGIFIHNCLSRYFKEYQNAAINSAYTATTRDAAFILTHSTRTKEDIISFYGVSPDRVLLVPIEFEMICNNYSIQTNKQEIKPYFVWPTNINLYNNHINAAEGLIQYFSEGGKIPVVVTGLDTEQLDPKLKKEKKIELPHVSAFRDKVQKSNLLKKHLYIRPNLTKQECCTLISGACFIWYPAQFDIEADTLIDAAVLGVPGLCASSPYMQFFDDYFQLHLAFFDSDSLNAMKQSLQQMERDWENRKKLLPLPETISNLNWENSAIKYWFVIKELL